MASLGHLFLLVLCGSAIAVQGAVDASDEKLNSILRRFEELEKKSDIMMRRLELINRMDSCQTPLAPLGNSLETRRTASATHGVASVPSKTLSLCRSPGISQLTGYGRTPFPVLCDKNRWLVVLQRFNGRLNFRDRDWKAYKAGIGEVGATNEFFVGLEHLHQLTAAGAFELFVELIDHDDVRAWAQYGSFSVDDESTAYKLGSLGTYVGTAGDSFAYHEGQGFTTLDRDNDGKTHGSCGEEFNSAGWFKSCMEANLFGRYLPAKHDKFKEGMYWETFGGPETSLKSVKLMIRAIR